jgi:hypothetical protein
MRIGKTGVNPTMPVCHYCGETKNMIILTGYEGEKWAKKNGIPSGEMPMTVYIENDIEPCDECKKKGIAIVEVVSDEDHSFTGRRWLMKEEAVIRIFGKQPSLPQILQKRVLIIPKEVTERIGL